MPQTTPNPLRRRTRDTRRGWVLIAVLAVIVVGGIFCLLKLLPKPQGLSAGAEDDASATQTESTMDEAMQAAYAAQRQADDKRRGVEREIRRAETGEDDSAAAAGDDESAYGEVPSDYGEE